MRNFITKTLYIATALLCTVSSFAEDFSVDGIYYKITSQEERTVDVTYRGNDATSYTGEYSGVIVIPETVIYNDVTYTVTGIGISTMSGCRSVSQVMLPNTIRTIGRHAFNGCNNLTEILIPEGVTSIGNNAFYYCTSLKKITLPHSLTYIGEKAFDNVKASSLCIYENVTYAEYAFSSFKGDLYCYSRLPPQGVTSNFEGKIHCLNIYNDNYVTAGITTVIPDAPMFNVNSLTSHQESYSCKVGELGKMNILCEPSYASDPGLTYVTPNTNIIGLNNTTGDFIGLADGEATVTVFSTDGGNAKTNVKVIVGTGVEAKSLKCDVNGDGKVSMEDANIVVNTFLGK